MRAVPTMVTPITPRRVGPGAARKIALIGTADTAKLAPWDDPSWEIWAHASAWNICKRVDRWFDLHPESRWSEKKKWHPDYAGWLARSPVPVYMQKHYTAIPPSVRYPKERVLMEFPRYHSGQASWMMALALIEGVTHLGFFGIHYSLETEYAAQRAGCEFWMGVAVGRGVQLVIPDTVPLLKEPHALYGYEDAEWHAWAKQWKDTRSQTAVIPAKRITPLTKGTKLPPAGDDVPDEIARHLERARENEFHMMLDTPAASSITEPAGVTHE